MYLHNCNSIAVIMMTFSVNNSTSLSIHDMYVGDGIFFATVFANTKY